MLSAVIEFGELIEIAGDAIDTYAGEAIFTESIAEFGEGDGAINFEWGGEEQSGAGFQLEDTVDDLVGGLFDGGLLAVRAVGLSESGEEDAEVVIDFGDGTDGGSGSGADGFLFDGDSGAEPMNALNFGSGHLSEKLSGVRGEAFDVASLTFGVEGIHGE